MYLEASPLPEETEAVLLLAHEKSEEIGDTDQALTLLAEVRQNENNIERHVWRVLRKQMRSRPYRGNRAAVFALFLLVCVGLAVLVVGLALSWF